MKFFAQAVSDNINAFYEGNQRSFSRRTKIAPGAISKYTRGKELPSPENLAKIIAAVPDSQGELLAALFRDIASAAGVHELRINVSRGAQKTMRLDASVEALVARSEDLIRKNEKFRQIVGLLVEST